MTEPNFFSETSTIEGGAISQIKMQEVEKFIISLSNNFATIFPYMTTVFPILLSLILLEPRGALFSAGTIFSLLINILLKIMIKQSRPSSASNCDIFSCDYEPTVPKKINFGMPSGHAQAVGFILGFLISKMYYDNKFEALPIATIIIVLFLVCWSRVFKKCHSFIQVFVGSLIGIIIGLVYYKLIRKFYEKYDTKKNETNNICIASDDNEYKCDTIKDGYVINHEAVKEEFKNEISKQEIAEKRENKLSERQFQNTSQLNKIPDNTIVNNKMTNEQFTNEINTLHKAQLGGYQGNSNLMDTPYNSFFNNTYSNIV